MDDVKEWQCWALFDAAQQAVAELQLLSAVLARADHAAPAQPHHDPPAELRRQRDELCAAAGGARPPACPDRNSTFRTPRILPHRGGGSPSRNF